jgi:DNA-binding transcriptional MerR regulator
MDEKSYSIQELSELSGLPRRTIHFYTQQGLLPPPSGAGLGAHYDAAHLLRLQLIPRLREQGLRLDEIRARLAGLDRAGLEQLSIGLGPVLRPAVELPTQVGTSYLHYPLPGGLTLIVPSARTPVERRRIDQVLAAARRILAGQPRANPPSAEEP